MFNYFIIYFSEENMFGYFGRQSSFWQIPSMSKNFLIYHNKLSCYLIIVISWVWCSFVDTSKRERYIRTKTYSFVVVWRFCYYDTLKMFFTRILLLLYNVIAQNNGVWLVFMSTSRKLFYQMSIKPISRRIFWEKLRFYRYEILWLPFKVRNKNLQIELENGVKIHKIITI